jgi:predicted negative regulator of RcsB-dependent stress response
VALFTYAAVSSLNWYQRSQAAEAAKLYETLLGTLTKNERDKTYLAADDLQKKFAGTTYAAMGSLVAAKIASDANDGAKAQTYLKWAANKASDDAYRALAQLRLVGLFIDQGTDAAMSEADQILKGKAVKGFEPLWIERRGDWFLAQKKTVEARTQYLNAWKLLEKDKSFPEDSKRLLKVKIDAVGGM